jgi:D-ribulokinase
MVPGLWLSEGGQSSAGAALDQLIVHHPAWNNALASAKAEGKSLPQWLADAAAKAAPSLSEAVHLADALHVVPDFLGNRSPFADPEARAVVAGLGMDRGVDSLVALYIAGLLGIGYGLRQIIDASRRQGATIEAIAISGGAGSHPLARQLLADCTGLPVLVPAQAEPVLLGAAMLGATAGGAFASLREAMGAMSSTGETFAPAGGDFTQFHDKRFAAFEALQQTARSIRAVA